MVRLKFFILRSDLDPSKFIDIITGRSRSPSHKQSRVEPIRVPGYAHLVLVDTPALTSSVPQELDIISQWLRAAYVLFSSGISSFLSDRS